MEKYKDYSDPLTDKISGDILDEQQREFLDYQKEMENYFKLENEKEEALINENPVSYQLEAIAESLDFMVTSLGAMMDNKEMLHLSDIEKSIKAIGDMRTSIRFLESQLNKFKIK